MATIKTVSDDDLLKLEREGRKYEIVDGEIQVSPAGMRHGQVIIRLAVRLASFVDERGLGSVFDSSTGYRLASGNLRVPDVSFVAKGRLPEGPAPRGFGEAPPDLAIEVLSPGDDRKAMLKKVDEYLRVGVCLIWVVDPEKREAAVYRPSSRAHVTIDGVLDGEDVVPGFRCPLGALLD